MDSILRAVESFQATSENQIDEKIFLEYMRKVTIWDYFAITKTHYLSLPESEKLEKINKYYFDMKSRSCGGKMFCLFVCVFLTLSESLDMSLEWLDFLLIRDGLERVDREAHEYLSTHSYYCKNCRACAINSRLQKELKRNNFYSKNKHIKLWHI